MSTHWSKLAVVGVGLLGGSIGMAVKQRRLAGRVDGYVRRAASVDDCLKAGAVDNASTDLFRAIEGADLIVLATPLGQMLEITTRLLPALKRGAIVTDVGSVKGSVVAELESPVAAAGGHFIGSHPMAGAEKTGVRAARSDLFENAICVVTPTAAANKEALVKVEEFWSALGGVPVRMSPELHDDLVSRSSHLPHVVAAELANYVLSPVHPKEQAVVCATGFRDTTRIASGSPEMWRDIALANRLHLARVLGVFIEDLQEFQHALETQDAKVIEEFFQQAKLRRDTWQSASASPSPE